MLMCSDLQILRARLWDYNVIIYHTEATDSIVPRWYYVSLLDLLYSRLPIVESRSTTIFLFQTVRAATSLSFSGAAPTILLKNNKSSPLIIRVFLRRSAPRKRKTQNHLLLLCVSSSEPGTFFLLRPRTFHAHTKHDQRDFYESGGGVVKSSSIFYLHPLARKF